MSYLERSSPSNPRSLHGHSQVWASAYPTSPVEEVCWGRGSHLPWGPQHSLRCSHLELAWGLKYPLPERASLESSPITLPGLYGRDEMAKQHGQVIATSLGVPHPPVPS